MLGPLNDIVLLPTAWTHLERPDKDILEIRCLLFTGVPRSTFSSAVVAENGITTFKLNEEILCNVKLALLYDSRVLSLLLAQHCHRFSHYIKIFKYSTLISTFPMISIAYLSWKHSIS